MNLLDQIIFVADYIEPGRDSAPHLDELRKMALTDLEQTVCRILEDTVTYVSTHHPSGMDPTTLAACQFYSGKLSASNRDR